MSSALRQPMTMAEFLDWEERQATATIDRVAKQREYRATPPARRYVMLEQDRIAATVVERHGEDWSQTPVEAGEMLDMPEIGISLPLKNLYIGVDLPDPKME